MAVAIQVKLDGAEELVKLLKQVPRTVGKKHMRRAIRQGIVMVRQTIKATAPIRSGASRRGVRRGQKQARPGRLRRLVRVRSRRGKRGYLKVSLSYPTEGRSDDPKNAFYWRFVVDGFVHTNGTFIQGNDYIQRAVDINFRAILRHVIRETNAGVREELAKNRTK